MSSLHHLPRDNVESKVWSHPNTEGELVHNLIEDLDCIDNNGTAFGQYFETIDIMGDESVIIASDSLRGLQFNGFITKFDRIEDVPQMPVLSLAPVYGGVSNLMVMRDKTMVCTFDSGHISKLSQGLEEVMSVLHHDNQICGLSVDRLETKSITCGYDMSLLVLDLNTFEPVKYYRYGHSAVIWDNVFNQFDDNLVLSCSRDKNVLLWDLRKPRPATKVMTVPSEPTSLCWSAKDISSALVGTASGQIISVDIRNPSIEESTFNSTGSRIHRMKNVFNGRAIAICSDDNNLLVLEPNGLKVVYEDKSHTNWVRAVTQHNNLLYSVGRDCRLVSHSDFTPTELSDTLSIIS